MAREFKVYPTTDIGLACDPDDKRYALGGVLISNGYAIACNGKALAVAPCDACYCDDGSPVEGEEVIAGKPFKSIKIDKRLGISKPAVVNGRVEYDGKLYDRPEGRFPNWRQVLANPTGRTVHVTLNADILAQLAAAINAKGSDNAELVTLELTIDDDSEVTQPIAISGNGDGIGVLMPCVTHKEQRTKYATQREKCMQR